MPKYQTINDYLDTLNNDALNVYHDMKKCILSLDESIKERLFAGQIAFYIEQNLKRTFHESPVVILTFFKDHVNVFASKNMEYKEQLKNYKFTNKGTMQIYYNMVLEEELLSELFIKSLS
jgi:hypothetical protein